MSRVFIVIGAVLAGAAAATLLAYGNLLPGLKRGSGTATTTSGTTSPATSAGKPARAAPEKIVALARLEPAAGILELGGVPGDRVALLKVKPGDLVRKNDVLLEFDSRTLRQLQYDAAKSQLDEATKRLAQEQIYADTLVAQAELAVSEATQNLDKLEVSAQEARIQTLRQSATTAQADFDRVSKLSVEVRSEQQLQRSQLVRDQAANELAAAEKQLEKLKAGVELRKQEAQNKLAEAKAGRAKVDAAVPLDSLKKAVAAADEQLKSAALKAPSDGIVLEVLCDQGDTVGQLPLVRMGNVDAMAAVAEVYETQVGNVFPGQSATITADALPGKLIGKVDRVSAVVGKNRFTSLLPTQSTDTRVVEVRILVDDENGWAKKFVNLQVTATIDVQGGK